MKNLIPLSSFIFSFSMFVMYSYLGKLGYTIVHGTCAVVSLIILIKLLNIKKK